MSGTIPCFPDSPGPSRPERPSARRSPLPYEDQFAGDGRHVPTWRLAPRTHRDPPLTCAYVIRQGFGNVAYSQFPQVRAMGFKSALDCRTITTLPARVGGPVVPTRLAAVTISGSRGLG